MKISRLRADEEGSDEGKIAQEGSQVHSSILPSLQFSPSCRKDSLHHLSSFWKTLTASNVNRNVRASLEFPEDFWRTHGRRFHTAVKLQWIHEQSPVRTMTYHTCPDGLQNRHLLRAEWRAFVTENHLKVGQQLLFTLSADSCFVVRDQSACSSA